MAKGESKVDTPIQIEFTSDTALRQLEALAAEWIKRNEQPEKIVSTGEPSFFPQPLHKRDSQQAQAGLA